MTNPNRTPTPLDKAAEIIRRCKRYSKHSEMRKPYSLNNLAYRHGIANSTVNSVTWACTALLLKINHNRNTNTTDSNKPRNHI
jgi:hypothetical protein